MTSNNLTYKEKLYRICSDLNIQAPQYTLISTKNGNYSSKVVVFNQSFYSPLPLPSRTSSEDNAAKVALLVLGYINNNNLLDTISTSKDLSLTDVINDDVLEGRGKGLFRES